MGTPGWVFGLIHSTCTLTLICLLWEYAACPYSHFCHHGNTFYSLLFVVSVVRFLPLGY